MDRLEIFLAHVENLRNEAKQAYAKGELEQCFARDAYEKVLDLAERLLRK